MKRVIYVDYENVNIGGLAAIEKLGADDCVKIFIGARTSKLSMVDADRIFNSEAQVELITNKYIGKNALDFIIMVHMGYDVAHELGKEYYIVSNDKGYDPAIQELRRVSGNPISRKPDINEVVGQKKSVIKKALGIIGLGKEKEAKDTTEHHVIKDRKRGERKLAPEMVQTEAEAEASENKDKPASNRRSYENRNGSRSNNRNGNKNRKPKTEQKANEAKEVVNTAKTVDNKPEVSQNNTIEASGQVNNTSPSKNKSKNHNRNRGNRKNYNNTSAESIEKKVLEINSETDGKESSIKCAEKQVANKPSGNSNVEKTGKSGKGKAHNNKPKKEQADEAKLKDEAMASLKEADEKIEAAQNNQTNTSNKDRNRKRRNNRNSYKNNGTTAVERNETSNASASVLTKEQEERNRERAAAFALLEELNNE